MVTVFGLSLLSPPVFAESSQEEEQIFIYEYNGIEFSGNVELTQEQLSNMYAEVMGSPTESSEIGVMGRNPDGSTVIVVKPTYRTYKNKGAKAAAELLSAYIISKAPKPVKTSVFGGWVLTKLSGWANAIKPTYVGAWVTSSWSRAENKRLYFNTLVHYKKSNYTQPKSVQYWESTSWWTK